jgi:hypothetical protein
MHIILGQGPKSPGANVIKLLLSVIYRFSYLARVFVKLDYKSLQMTNTSLLQKSVIYGQKTFYNIGLWSQGYSTGLKMACFFKLYSLPLFLSYRVMSYLCGILRVGATRIGKGNFDFWGKAQNVGV